MGIANRLIGAPMSQSILFIQDDADAALLWADLLRHKNLNIITARPEEDISDQLQDQQFDLIMVSTFSNRHQSVEVCQKLRRMFANPILFIASGRDEDFVLQVYAAGIDEYIPTSIDPRVFLAKVNAWLRHAWTVSASALNHVQINKIHLDTDRREITLPNRSPQKLTNLEFRVLHLLMTHFGEPLETNQIIDRVWGYSGISDESVLLKNVIYRLRRKIERDPAQSVHIVTIPGVGYSFHADRVT
jgi:DNA-binding response OmpR family regulator